MKKDMSLWVASSYSIHKKYPGFWSVQNLKGRSALLNEPTTKRLKD